MDRIAKELWFEECSDKSEEKRRGLDEGERMKLTRRTSDEATSDRGMSIRENGSAKEYL